MSERRITTLLLIGFGAAATAMLEILNLFIDFRHVTFIAIGIVCALLLWTLFYLDDAKNK